MAKKNFTISTVATAPSPATSGTSLVVASGDGSLFAVNEPAIIFPVNDQPLVANAEIVMVTNVATDTLTITRGQESTTPRDIQVGDIIMQGMTAKDYNDLLILATHSNRTDLDNVSGTNTGDDASIPVGYLDTDGTLAGDSDVKVPTQKAVKTYIDDTKFTWKEAWATSTAYVVNDSVQENGSGYICLTAHTSGTFATDLAAGKWSLFVEGLPEPNLTTATTTNLTGYLYGDGTNIASKGTIDGWIPAGETWTYASADDPTFTFTVAADVTTKYSAGMKIKLTQGTVKYFIITAVSTYSGGNTTITVYGGTDYDLADAAISLNYYSTQKAPYGFPVDPNKWTVKGTAGTGAQNTPTANVWYNINSNQITIPIGVWRLMYKIGIYTERASSAFNSVLTTLSTANNNQSDGDFTTIQWSAGTHAIGINQTEKILTLASKTTYYMNHETTYTSASSIMTDPIITGYLKAICAYL